ncbi:MAG TPA: OsmC family protein [Bacteroidia bacterium]|jgi:putative redox protein|nr:OsmC family protein [Bacteroidia bacterium]
MKINIHRLNDAYLFEARNEANVTMQMDANPEIGGGDAAFRPVQALVASLGGCSGIDVIMILKKQKQQIDDFDIEIEAEREKDKTPSLVTGIHLKFKLKGKIDADKLEKAIELSIGKYCTVAKMLEKTAKITYSYQIN